MLINNATWDQWSDAIAAPANPEEYVEAAVERLVNELKPYIVDVKGVRPQFKALNSVQIIDFKTAEEKKFYDEAYDRYLAEKNKAENDESMSAGQRRWDILVALLQFRRAAELCRAHHLAEAMYVSVQNGQAAVCACNFKDTISKIVTILVNDYNVSRDKISLVWGGGKTKASKKQKLKATLTKNESISAIMKEVGLTLDELNLENVADYIEQDIDPALDLGIQSKIKRQEEIDKFQRGESVYCLFTFKAGGVGLSLHHADEQTEYKVKRKKNNFAVVDDIPNVPTHPRVCFLAPTYSAIELVQGLGRCPRLTSLSDTSQLIVFYRGTVEERVAAIVNIKLRCLRKVVRTKESWESIVTNAGSDKSENEMRQLVAASEQQLNNDVEDASLLLTDGSEEE